MVHEVTCGGFTPQGEQCDLAGKAACKLRAPALNTRLKKLFTRDEGNPVQELEEMKFGKLPLGSGTSNPVINRTSGLEKINLALGTLEQDAYGAM